MRCIISRTNNPFFNIAAEEYLLKNSQDDIFMLYVNEPSVIVGKHQNTLAEIDYSFAREKGIRVVRRLSGGGAVYHDLGNVNFTFIKNGKEGALVDFKGYTKPIIDALKALGLDARFEGHNSIYVNGLKISGNAEHILKQRVMHHGTLLFSSDLDMLAQILYVNENRYTHKAVRSVRAKVGNIIDFLEGDLPINEFMQYLMNFMIKNNKGAIQKDFTVEEKAFVDKLIEDKYSKWDWNFGYSPAYTFKREGEIDFDNVYLNVEVEKGKLINLELMGSAFNEKEKQEIKTALLGCNHNWDEIENALKILKCTDKTLKILQQLIF